MTRKAVSASIPLGLAAALAAAALFGGGATANPKEPILFMSRAAEPREKAFTFLLPRGWSVEGGIFRLDASRAGGPGNAMEAKVDIAFKREPAGLVMLRRLPKVNYADGPMVRATWAPGANYQGMQVAVMPTVEQYLDNLFRGLRPAAADVRVVERQDRSDLVRAIAKAAEALNANLRMGGLPPVTFYAGAKVVTYTERGVRFKEALFTVLVDFRGAAALWANDHTTVMRAPEAEAAAWKPVFDIILDSVKFDPRWVAGEIRGQDERGRAVVDIMRDLQRIDREIADHRARTNAGINTDQYLTLTGQEDYVNPHTSEIERDTNAFKYRWVTPNGEYAYTNVEHYDPNVDPEERRRGWKMTPVRERKID